MRELQAQRLVIETLRYFKKTSLHVDVGIMCRKLRRPDALLANLEYWWKLSVYMESVQVHKEALGIWLLGEDIVKNDYLDMLDIIYVVIR